VVVPLRQLLRLVVAIVVLLCISASPLITATVRGFRFTDSVWGYVSFSIAFVVLNSLYLTAAFCAAVATRVRFARLTFAIWLAIDFWIRAIEIVLMQNFAVGYGPEFFYYFDKNAIVVALQSFPSLAVTCALVSTGVAIVGHHLLSFSNLQRAAAVRMLPVMLLLWVLSASVISSPQSSIAVISIVKSGVVHFTKPVPELPLLTDEERAHVAERGLTDAISYEGTKHTGHNILIVFVESLQLNLTSLANADLAGATPNLERFARENTWFVNFFSTANDTVQGLYSAICGVVPVPDLAFITSVEQRNDRCLPSDLQTQGYHTVFLMGGSHRFGSKGRMLRRHGFQSVIGREELLERSPQLTKQLNPWGLNDPDLMRDFLDQLDRDRISEPYLAAILTVNNHIPGFSAKDCPGETGHALVDGLKCTDSAIGVLLNGLEARQLLDRTIVIIVADHHYHSQLGLPQSAEDARNSEWGRHRIYAAARVPYSRPRVDRRLRYLADLPAMLLEDVGFRVSRYRAGVGEGEIALRRSIVTHSLEATIVGGAIRTQTGDCIDSYADATIDAAVPWKDCARQKALLYHNLMLLPPPATKP
jgi:hypothetical protein